MTEIRFYHLFSMTLEKALPVLLEKVLERDWRALIITDSLERVTELDSGLWTYKPSSFLPHGMVGDEDAESQPILITHKDETPTTQMYFSLLTVQKVCTSENLKCVVCFFLVTIQVV